MAFGGAKSPGPPSATTCFVYMDGGFCAPPHIDSLTVIAELSRGQVVLDFYHPTLNPKPNPNPKPILQLSARFLPSTVLQGLDSVAGSR